MIIGSCIIKIMIYDANSLKDKRQVMKSIISRLQSKFNISIAEVGLNDIWRSAEIGFVCVTNDTVHANKVISNVLKFINKDTRVEIISNDIEIL